jgi:two-component system sensor histidine kinase CiaH
MFRSATFKLTSWYLAIIIAVSLLFSVVIYIIATNEVSSRIDNWQTTPLYSINKSRYLTFREQQIHQAEANLIFSLAMSNVAIWTLGGFGSYYLARRSLKPIEEAHEAQSRFTSDASHELRTPLASMKTEIEVALRDPKLSKPEMRELLASNLEEVNKLTRLSQTLLQLSRLDHVGLQREKILIYEVAESVIERLDKYEKRVELTGNKSLKLVTNKASLEELITILIDNALKYSPEGSKIRMNLLTKKHMVGFEIINEGEGIDAEALPHIFDRFYRVDSSRSTTNIKGHGLGLALAKKIVEVNGGDLSVSSAPQHETTFRVFLQNLSESKAKNQS